MLLYLLLIHTHTFRPTYTICYFTSSLYTHIRSGLRITICYFTSSLYTHIRSGLRIPYVTLFPPYTHTYVQAYVYHMLLYLLLIHTHTFRPMYNHMQSKCCMTCLVEYLLLCLVKPHPLQAEAWYIQHCYRSRIVYIMLQITNIMTS